MKKFLLAFVLTAFGLCAQAQEGWVGSVEFSPGIFNVDKGVKETLFGFKGTATHQVYDYMSVGFGAGLQADWNFKSAPYIPVFARFHGEDFKRSFTPYVTVDMGVRIPTEASSMTGFFFNPQIGIRYQSISLGVGYLGHVKSGLTNYVEVTLGYHFGYGINSKEEAKEFFKNTEISISGGPSFPSGEYEHKGFVTDLAFLWPVKSSDRFYLGLSTGVHCLEHTYGFYNGVGASYTAELTDDKYCFPIALRGKYKMLNLKFGKFFYPWVQLDLGSIVSKSASNLYWSPAAGVSFDIKDGAHSIDLGVKLSNFPVIGLVNKNESKKHNVNMFSVTLGFSY